MRLSGYGANQLNNEKIKSASDEKGQKSIQLKDGESYKGKITFVDGLNIKVNVNGKEYSAIINSGNLNAKNIGEQIEFKVTITDKGMLIDIKENTQNLNMKNIDSLILLLNVEKTEANKSIITVLNDFKIPVTKENFDEIKSFVNSKDLMVSTLNDKLGNSNGQVDFSKLINKDLNLKENLLNIFKLESQNFTLQTNKLENNVASSNSNVELSEVQSKLEVQNSKTENLSIEAKINIDVKVNSELVKNNPLEIDIKDNNILMSKESLPIDKIEQISKENLNEVYSLKSNEGNSSLASESKANEVINPDKKLSNENIEGMIKFVNSLKELDETSFIFNKEMQIPNAVKNLIGFDNLINMKDSIINQLKNFLESAFEHGDDKAKLRLILKEIADVKLDDFKKLEQILDKAANVLESQKTPLVDKVKDDIVLLKDSIQYIKEINNQLVYIQTPIDINGEIRDLEMGFKKSKDKKENNFKIFISLETLNLGLVQSLIKINEDQIDIAFKVEEEFDDYFSDNYSVISENLSNLGYTRINLSNIVREKKLNLTDLFIDEKNEVGEFNFLV